MLGLSSARFKFRPMRYTIELSLGRFILKAFLTTHVESSRIVYWLYRSKGSYHPALPCQGREFLKALMSRPRHLPSERFFPCISSTSSLFASPRVVVEKPSKCKLTCAGLKFLTRWGSRSRISTPFVTALLVPVNLCSSRSVRSFSLTCICF